MYFLTSRKRERFVRLLCPALFWICITTALGLYVGPKVEVRLARGLASPSNTTREKSFLERHGIPLIEYFPINIKEHSTICDMYELFNLLITGTTAASTDLFVYSVLNVLWAHHEVLIVMFTDLNRTANQFFIGELEMVVRNPLLFWSLLFARLYKGDFDARKPT